MSAFWQIARRFIFFVFLSFLMLNTIVYLALNSPKVQKTVVGAINDRYLSSLNLKLQLDSLSFNFFSSALKINHGKILSIDQKNQEEHPVLKFDSVALGVEPVHSYQKKNLQLSFLKIDGAEIDLFYDSNGEIIIPFQLTKTENKPLRFQGLFTKIKGILPAQLEVINSNINVGVLSSANYQHLNIGKIFIKNDQEAGENHPLQVIGDIGQSKFLFPFLQAPFVIENVLLDFSITHLAQVAVERLDGNTNAGSFGSKGTVNLGPNFVPASYQMKTSVEIKFKEFMSLLGVRGDGKINFNGSVDSGATLTEIPKLHGDLIWTQLSAQNYAIYSGSSSLIVKNQVAKLPTLFIKTPLGAKIKGSGEFELFGTFKFKVKTLIHDFKFSELMAGLTVPTSSVDFNMDTQAVDFDGHIHLASDRIFEINAVGPVRVTQFAIPSGKDKVRAPMPPCVVQLALFSDARELQMQHTSASCSGDLTDKISVNAGNIKYKSGQILFKLKGDNVDLELAEPFLETKTRGKVNFDGVLSGGQGKDLTFSADTLVRNAFLYGVTIHSLEGRLSLNSKKFIAERLKAIFESENASAQVFFHYFSIAFANLHSKINATASGDISALSNALSSYFPNSAPEVEGSFNTNTISLEGPLLQPKGWDLAGTLNAKNIRIPQGRANNLLVSLSCVHGHCKDSKILAAGIQIAQNPISSSQIRPTPVDSRLAIAVHSLSFQDGDLRGEIKRLPILSQMQDGRKFKATLDSEFSVRGEWEKWEGTLAVHLDDVKLGDEALGPVVVTAISHGGGDINAVASGRYNQLMMRIRVPHNLRGQASLYLNTRAFDFAFALPIKTRSKYNLLSLVDAEMLFEGPCFFLSTEKDNKNLRSQWIGNGKISRFSGQFEQLQFNLQAPVSMKFADSNFRLNDTLIETNKGTLGLKGGYNFLTDEIIASLEAHADFDIFQDLSPIIGSSSGKINAQLDISGGLKKISVVGNAHVKGDILNLNEYAPPLTQVEGEFNFDDDKLEIQFLRAHKGDGSIELAGGINWSKILSGEQKEPGIALKLVAKNAQVRIPVPVFDSFDTIFDADLEFTGESVPYKLAGQVKIPRSRAYKDISCTDIVRTKPGHREGELQLNSKAFAVLDLSIDAEDAISIQSQCFRGKLSSSLKVTGSTNEPALAGNVTVDSGTINFLKSHFDIKKGELIFDNSVRIDPKIDAQLVASIESYKVFVSVDGLLSKPRTNLWADPAASPDGETLGQGDILRMLGSGQAPRSGGGQSTGQTFVSQVAGYVYGVTSLDESLSQAFSRLTGGFIDSVQLQPVIENGQTKWKARVSRSLGERLNLGLDVEQSPQVNNQSLTGTVFINDSVNLLGGFDRKSSQAGSYSELSGGMRFQFGSK